MQTLSLAFASVCPRLKFMIKDWFLKHGKVPLSGCKDMVWPWFKELCDQLCASITNEVFFAQVIWDGDGVSDGLTFCNATGYMGTMPLKFDSSPGDTMDTGRWSACNCSAFLSDKDDGEIRRVDTCLTDDESEPRDNGADEMLILHDSSCT